MASSGERRGAAGGVVRWRLPFARRRRRGRTGARRTRTYRRGHADAISPPSSCRDAARRPGSGLFSAQPEKGSASEGCDGQHEHEWKSPHGLLPGRRSGAQTRSQCSPAPARRLDFDFAAWPRDGCSAPTGRGPPAPRDQGRGRTRSDQGPDRPTRRALAPSRFGTSSGRGRDTPRPSPAQLADPSVAQMAGARPCRARQVGSLGRARDRLSRAQRCTRAEGLLRGVPPCAPSLIRAAVPLHAFGSPPARSGGCGSIDGTGMRVDAREVVVLSGVRPRTFRQSTSLVATSDGTAPPRTPDHTRSGVRSTAGALQRSPSARRRKLAQDRVRARLSISVYAILRCRPASAHVVLGVAVRTLDALKPVDAMSDTRIDAEALGMRWKRTPGHRRSARRSRQRRRPTRPGTGLVQLASWRSFWQLPARIAVRGEALHDVYQSRSQDRSRRRWSRGAVVPSGRPAPGSPSPETTEANA